MHSPASKCGPLGKARPGVALTACVVCCFSLFAPASSFTSPVADHEDGSVAVMLDLLSATQSGEHAFAMDPDTLSMDLFRPAEGSPFRPLFDFLLAEVYRLRGDSAKAYTSYVEAAAPLLSPPDGGGMRFESLTAASLLRALDILGSAPEPDPEKASRLIGLAEPLLREGSANTMLRVPVLGGLPALEATLFEKVANLAWSAGDRETAGLAFVKYLSTGAAGDLDTTRARILDYVVSSGLRSAGELALVRGKSLYRLRNYENAQKSLKDATAAGDGDTRAEAGYYLARTRSMQGAPRREILNLLTSALDVAGDADLIQEILLYRASVYNRPGSGRDTDRFMRDLEQIVRQFPAGGKADDALYSLAAHYEVEGEPEEALRQLARLRIHPGPNDWLDFSYFRAALILYSQSDEGDVAAAGDLLGEMLRRNPEGQLGLAARFWLGRMAEESGDTTSAHRHFRSVIEICPYDYYAIRARMHLNCGGEAALEVWPDSTTKARLAQSFKEARPGTPPATSRDDAGLLSPLRGRLYVAAYEAEGRLARLLPDKQQGELTMEDLDRAGGYASMVLLLALRQDIVRATAGRAGLDKRLPTASWIERTIGDWPLAMLLIFGLDRSIPTQSLLQHDPDYPAVAYPNVYPGMIAEAADSHDVPPELLYAVIRRESLFYTQAVSNRGAMGLFQFMPAVFATLDSRWKVLDGSGASSMEGFLRDPGPTIDLGARWFREELLERNDGDLLLAVMEHNAGYPAVKAWRGFWDHAGRTGDIEYMVETAEFTETRIFARSVLSDIAIADAADLFGGGRGTTGQTISPNR